MKMPGPPFQPSNQGGSRLVKLPAVLALIELPETILSPVLARTKGRPHQLYGLNRFTQPVLANWLCVHYSHQ
jgi:hypothetical protein